MINKDSHSECKERQQGMPIYCECKWSIHGCSTELVTRFNRKGEAYEICVACLEAHDKAFPTGMEDVYQCYNSSGYWKKHDGRF